MEQTKRLTKKVTLLAQRYVSDFSIPVELAYIVARRFPEYDDAKRFLFPETQHLHDPSTIPDIESAAQVIINALNAKHKILIYSHDDVDGYTSAALMYKTLSDLKRGDENSIFVYPIVREQDGYILNADVLREYKKRGVSLVVTVDFGISSEENMRVAEQEGLQLVVCDHHETRSHTFPVPAVDPKRNGSQYPFRDLAGVGVTFKLAHYLYKKVFKLSDAEFYNLKKEFFPLVMLGTIADRVTLLNENRIFCAQGLKLFSHLDEPWVRYFCPVKEAGMDIPRITGEVIPTIASAPYRDPAMGIGLLTSQSEMYINETIAQLKGVTAERRMGIDALFHEAYSQVKVLPSIVVSIVPATNQLYLGSVAARLRDSYGRTALLIGMKNGKGHGELRSHDVNLYDMLYRFKDFFIDFGGHHRAAGFTIVQDKLDSVVDGIIAFCEETTAPRKKEKSDEMPDIILKREDIRILMPLAPFGEGNPAPLLTDGSMVYTVNNKFEIMVRETRG